MRKKFRKITAVILTAAMAFSVATPVFAEDENITIDPQYIVEAQALLENDPEFIKDVTENGSAHGEEMIESLAYSLQRNATTSQNELKQMLAAKKNARVDRVHAPIIAQYNSYSCGPCSALQALYVNQTEDLVSGTTDVAKQQTLASEMGTASGVGTYVYRLVDTINDYVDVSSPKTGYKYLVGSSMELSTFAANVSWSLIYDAPAILHCKTEYLSYYNGKSSGHYICVSDIAYDDSTIELADCNWTSAYRGYFTISTTEAYNSIHIPADRYLIFV